MTPAPAALTQPPAPTQPAAPALLATMITVLFQSPRLKKYRDHEIRPEGRAPAAHEALAGARDAGGGARDA